MSLLNPLGLLGLLTIPLLLLIHFFRSNRREHGVSALLFWDMPDRPESRSLSRRLPLSLSLLLQLLLLVLLSLILAEPVLRRDAAGEAELWILVDTSASMGVPGSTGVTPMEAALQRIDQLLAESRGRPVRILAVDAELRQIGNSLQSAAELRAEARAIRHRNSSLDPTLLGAVLSDAPGPVRFLTDGAVDLASTIPPDSPFVVELPGEVTSGPAAQRTPEVRGRENSNQGIVALSRRDNPLRPGLAEILVSVANDADVPVSRDLQVRSPDGSVAVRTLTIPARAEASLVLDAEPGDRQLRLSGTDMFPADDRATIPGTADAGWTLASTGPIPASLRAIARTAGATRILPDMSLADAAAADLTVVSGAGAALPPGRYLLLGVPPQGIPVAFVGAGPAAPVRWGDVGSSLARQSPEAFSAAAAPVLQPGPGVRTLVGGPAGSLVYLGSTAGIRFAGFALNYFSESAALDPVFPLLVSSILQQLGLSGAAGSRLVRPGEILDLSVDPASPTSVLRAGEVLQRWEPGQSVLRYRMPADQLTPLELQSGARSLTLYPALLDRGESNLRPRVPDALLASNRADSDRADPARVPAEPDASDPDAVAPDPPSLLAGTTAAGAFDLRGILLILALLLGGIEVLVRVRRP